MSPDRLGAGRSRPHAEVVGAGFAGLTTAAALARTGWSVRLHERAADLREQGAGIVLWHNSLRVLDAIGARAAVDADSVTPPYYETRMHHESVSHEDFDGLDWRTLTRPHLHSCLRDAVEGAGVELRLGSEVISADADGAVTTADGERLEADLVVGADGVRSKVRDSLGFRQDRERHRDGITRFLVPRCRDELGAGEWDNVIDFWNLEPRYLRVLYVPCNARELYIALGAPRADSEGSATPINLELWEATYPELAPVLRAASRAKDPRYYGYQTTYCDSWTKGRVALVGDSAHAMCPALAQGAGLAMCNGYTLAAKVADVAPTDVATALATWEAEERGITDRCQALSGGFARSRAMAKGNQFTAECLEAARYDPTDPDRHRVPAGPTADGEGAA